MKPTSEIYNLLMSEEGNTAFIDHFAVTISAAIIVSYSMAYIYQQRFELGKTMANSLETIASFKGAPGQAGYYTKQSSVKTTGAQTAPGVTSTGVQFGAVANQVKIGLVDIIGSASGVVEPILAVPQAVAAATDV